MGKSAWRAVGAVVALGLLLCATALASGTPESEPPASEFEVYRKIGLGAAAAFAISMCVIGAAHAVARIGSAALGAAAEKPELLNRSLVFVALAEGLAVLGFVIAMMLVQRI